MLAKYKDTKKNHHDGVVFPSSSMVLMDERTPPPGAYAEGVGPSLKGFSRINLIDATSLIKM